jgi:hypothetical protein
MEEDQDVCGRFAGGEKLRMLMPCTRAPEGQLMSQCVWRRTLDNLQCSIHDLNIRENSGSYRLVIHDRFNWRWVFNHNCNFRIVIS